MMTTTEEIAAAEVSKAWFDLVEKDDRNSPEEYPDMCLITREELAGYIAAALSKLPPAPVREKMAPVQGYAAGIPWSMHLRAYDAYCKKWSPQPAMIDLEGRNCRGGFSVGELDGFIPGWRDELSEIARLTSLLGRARHHINAALDLNEDNRLALAVQGRALAREIGELPAIRALKTNPGNAA